MHKITAIETELKKQFQELFNTRELAPHLMEIVQNEDYKIYTRPEIFIMSFNNEFNLGSIGSSSYRLPYAWYDLLCLETKTDNYQEKVIISRSWITTTLSLNGNHMYSNHFKIDLTDKWMQLITDTFMLYYRVNEDNKLIVIFI
jgi:hypothetical protein